MGFAVKALTRVFFDGNKTLAYPSNLVFTELGSDTFDRANENPLSQHGIWTTAEFFSPLEIVDDQCVPTDADGDGAVYTGVSILQNQWAQITIETLTGGTGDEPTLVNLNLYTQGNNIGLSQAGFTCTATTEDTVLGSNSFQLFIQIGASSATLSNATVNVGDVFRFAVVGDTLCLLSKHNAGVVMSLYSVFFPALRLSLYQSCVGPG